MPAGRPYAMTSTRRLTSGVGDVCGPDETATSRRIEQFSASVPRRHTRPVGQRSAPRRRQLICTSDAGARHLDVRSNDLSMSDGRLVLIVRSLYDRSRPHCLRLFVSCHVTDLSAEPFNALEPPAFVDYRHRFTDKCVLI